MVQVVGLVAESFSSNRAMSQVVPLLAALRLQVDDRTLYPISNCGPPHPLRLLASILQFIQFTLHSDTLHRCWTASDLGCLYREIAPMLSENMLSSEAVKLANEGQNEGKPPGETKAIFVSLGLSVLVQCYRRILDEFGPASRCVVESTAQVTGCLVHYAIMTAELCELVGFNQTEPPQHILLNSLHWPSVELLNMFGTGKLISVKKQRREKFAAKYCISEKAKNLNPNFGKDCTFSLGPVFAKFAVSADCGNPLCFPQKSCSELLRCECGSVLYCSLACRKANWKQHKIVCKLLRAHQSQRTQTSTYCVATQEQGRSTGQMNQEDSRLMTAPAANASAGRGRQPLPRPSSSWIAMMLLCRLRYSIALVVTVCCGWARVKK
ncbi:unnamed protein product [Polarella glacialis]|uniref:MYND-type domain-containing protein n=1 Tax=Polarella glacialis TaxID=89957 RepID=A0A813KN04_POLGL|nr:unnamed protein product [Polarella glacialis]